VLFLRISYQCGGVVEVPGAGNEPLYPLLLTKE
jgi:hypothetical protein